MPFINPINYIDWDHPDDRAGWHTQNDALLALDPPYVYHVHKDNATQLGEALRQAIETPIPRFIREYEHGEHSEPANPEVELGELGGLGALRQRQLAVGANPPTPRPLAFPTHCPQPSPPPARLGDTR